MTITHTIDRRMLEAADYWEEEDRSHGCYCAICLSPGGVTRYQSMEELPEGHVPLLATDYGICCNCGLDTTGVKIPGRCGYQRWEPAYQIGVFDTDRAWGGSEEGGWWYDCGHRVRLLNRVFYTKSSAYAACRRVNGWLHLMRPDWVQISSVNYGGGHFEARIYPQGQVPDAFPQHNPHYE